VTRRHFVCGLAVLAGCLASFGLASAADAQQPASPRRIGVLLVAWLPEETVPQAFRQGLADAGYSEGRDVVIEWRSAKGNYDRVPELVADLVRRKVDVMVVDGTPTAQAAKRATATIPIVMTLVADPVGSGLVASLKHPGGNVTGLSLMLPDLSAKRLQLLKETVPGLSRVAVLWNPDNYSPKVIEELKAAAPSLSIELNFVSARTPEEFGPVFSAMSRAHSQAVYLVENGFFFAHRATLLKLATSARLPIIYGEKHFGLISYGANWDDYFRRSAWYVDRILKGAKPADLPIEQPTKLELVINLKTAKALGITIPESILLRADEVIR
jgi:putative tryptophan/tyrosine transport system substrate-binding protein